MPADVSDFSALPLAELSPAHRPAVEKLIRN